jgi:N-hydroxyarylamine O-acetyltransferase
MLREIGFTVTPIAAGVMRQLRGASTMGSHLCLLVRLDRDYLVDVGFGGALVAPLALTEGGCDHAPKACALSRTEDGYWRYAERPLAGGEPFGFDFRAEPADEALLDRLCRWQGKDQSSVFVQNLVVQRRDGECHLSLRGRVLTELAVDGERRTLVLDAGDIVSTLRERFGLDVPAAAVLWPKIAARHDEVMAAKPPVLPTT